MNFLKIIVIYLLLNVPIFIYCQDLYVSDVSGNKISIKECISPQLIVLTSTSNCTDCYKKISKAIKKYRLSSNKLFLVSLLIYCEDNTIRKRMAIADMKNLIDVDNYYFYKDNTTIKEHIGNDSKSPSILFVVKSKVFHLSFDELFNESIFLEDKLFNTINDILQ